MKINRKMFIVITLLIIASFLAGGYITEQKNSDARIERCSTMVLFAIDKVENGDLADQGTMKALISNVYAAYQFCDNTILANQLHDLWNYLIFESNDNLDAVKEIVLLELKDVLRAVKTSG